MLSLVTAWTDEDTRASTFGFAQIVEGIGRMCGDPILLRIFARSMRMEGVMMGLPFFVAAVCRPLINCDFFFIPKFL